MAASRPCAQSMVLVVSSGLSDAPSEVIVVLLDYLDDFPTLACFSSACFRIWAHATPSLLIYESAQTIQQDFIEAWMADYEEEYYTRNEEYYPDDWPSWYYDAGLLVDWQGVLSAETRLP